MYDYFRVSCAVIDTVVGDVKKNTAAVIEKMKGAARIHSDLVVFPELTLTGYTCADLFFQKALTDAAATSLVPLAEAAVELSISIAIGLPLRIRGQLYNCAVLIADGKLCGIVPKTYIPTYNEYYEKRWFSGASELGTLQEVSFSELGLPWKGTVPVGSGLIFDLGGAALLGMEICEDLWSPLPPSTFLALNGAEVIVNLSASNETISKRKYRRELVTQQSARLLCAYAYCSAGSGESTTDLVFSGHSLIAESGTLLGENDKLIDTNYTLTKDIDLGKLRADRVKLKTFKDASFLSGISARMIPVERATPIGGDGSLYALSKLPFVPTAKQDRLRRCTDIFQMQVAGLKKRLSVTGSKPVIGISGGLDSTLALLVCVEAIRQLDRPITDVIGITMPCFGTTGRTYHNALELMHTLGITCVEIGIAVACTQHFEDIGHDMKITDGTYENSQARERTQVLMDYASRVGGFVVGTGDLSELALGWCTYNGDHMSMYAVNVSIPKTLVRWMIDSLMEYNVFPKSSAVLRDVLDTPISPELLPPDAEGRIAQETESIVGPYALHDFFLYYMLRYGFAPDKIYTLACRAFSEDFDNDAILKWLNTFYRRFFSQQFKRSCMPDGVKVGSVCLSPRGDWRMPSDASAALWLDMLTKLKP